MTFQDFDWADEVLHAAHRAGARSSREFPSRAAAEAEARDVWRRYDEVAAELAERSEQREWWPAVPRRDARGRAERPATRAAAAPAGGRGAPRPAPRRAARRRRPSARAGARPARARRRARRPTRRRRPRPAGTRPSASTRPRRCVGRPGIGSGRMPFASQRPSVSTTSVSGKPGIEPWFGTLTGQRLAAVVVDRVHAVDRQLELVDAAARAAPGRARARRCAACSR